MSTKDFINSRIMNQFLKFGYGKYLSDVLDTKCETVISNAKEFDFYNPIYKKCLVLYDNQDKLDVIKSNTENSCFIMYSPALDINSVEGVESTKENDIIQKIDKQHIQAVIFWR